MTHVLINQLTEGQLEWAPVGNVIDKVELGTGEDRTTHLVVKGKDAFIAELKGKFPAAEDHKSIDEFFNVMRVSLFKFQTIYDFSQPFNCHYLNYII